MGKHVVTNKEIKRLYRRLEALPFVHKVHTCALQPGAASGKPRVEYRHGSAEPGSHRVPAVIKAGGCAQRVFITLRVDEGETFNDKLKLLLAEPEVIAN